MDLSPGHLFGSLIIGTAGFAIFNYGRKQRRVPQFTIGIAMMVFPYFVGNIAAMFAIAGGLAALLWVVTRLGL